jgi:hypothetical protein
MDQAQCTHQVQLDLGLSYNKSLLRAGTHKVLARGRAPSLHGRALCARALLRRRRAAAELNRYTTDSVEFA